MEWVDGPIGVRKQDLVPFFVFLLSVLALECISAFVLGRLAFSVRLDFSEFHHKPYRIHKRFCLQQWLLLWQRQP